jgi:hypothetical protein
LDKQVKKDSDLYKTELKPIHYLAGCVGFIVLWQSIMMYLWITYTEWDWALLRFSLSNSDAMSIAALALALWSLHLFYKNKQQMLSKVDGIETLNNALSKRMKPEDIEIVLDSIVEHELLPRARRIKRIEEQKRRRADGNATGQQERNKTP